MEIEKNLSKKGTFAELEVGEVFLFCNDVYMVLEEDYGLGEDRPYYGYAVLLGTGSIYSFESGTEVTKLTAKLTVTG